MKKLIIPLVLLSIILTGCTSTKTIPSQACTEEAKVCPDGSAVGRTQPNCEFAACPGEVQTACVPTCSCPAGYRQEGESCNPECYYSTPKCLAPSRQCEPTNNCVQNK